MRFLKSDNKKEKRTFQICNIAKSNERLAVVKVAYTDKNGDEDMKLRRNIDANIQSLRIEGIRKITVRFFPDKSKDLKLEKLNSVVEANLRIYQ